MIDARGLTKRFNTRRGPVEAVNDVDLEAGARELVGFLGPNGAGKTTTMRMLTTLLTPTAGTATVAGCDLRTDPVGVRRSIGYVAQGGSTAPEARAGEEVVDHARLRGMPRRDAQRRTRDLFARLDLTELWERPCASLSGGQRRRLDLAMGLVHAPRLLFLDEPTAGLDPHARACVWEHLRRLRDRDDTTVFLSTHYLEEADALCERVLIIDGGRIVARGTPEQLKRQLSGDTVRVELADARHAPEARRALDGITGAGNSSLHGRDFVARVPVGATALPELLRALDARGVALAAVEVRRPTLDDVFLALTGRSLHDRQTTAASPVPA